MKNILLILVILTISISAYASGGIPNPISNMTFDEYNTHIVNEAMKKFENREQIYRNLYLFSQVIAVIFCALIPILINSMNDDKKKKAIITSLSIGVIFAIGFSSVFNFKEQSIINGTAYTKLRINFIDYDTNQGQYSGMTDDSIKLNRYKVLAEEIIINARKGLIETLPKPQTSMPNVTGN